MSFKFFQSVPQVLIFGPVGGVHAGVDHGLHRPIAGQGNRSGILQACHRVAHTGIGNGFDGSGQIAHLAGPQGIPWGQAQGFMVPTSTTLYTAPVAIILMSMPVVKLPSLTRRYTITPR